MTVQVRIPTILRKHTGGEKQVEALRAAAALAPVPTRIERFAGAGHAFFNDARPDAYRPAAAADAFPRAVRFLHEHLG